MGRLSNHLWRRTVECFLLAGKQENDGALPPVEEMAWTLRLSEDKLLEDFHGLAEAGVVHEGDAGQWFVTNFKKRQAAVPVGERMQGEGEPEEVPRTPREAMAQQDIRVFMAATGGQVPGVSQYAPVIDVMRLLRTRKGLDDARLVDFLAPYWLAWSTRKRRDGKPYDPGNISWLTEWVLNETIPGGGKEASLSLAEHNAAVIREVARRKNGRRI